MDEKKMENLLMKIYLLILIALGLIYMTSPKKVSCRVGLLQ